MSNYPEQINEEIAILQAMKAGKAKICFMCAGLDPFMITSKDISSEAYAAIYDILIKDLKSFL